MSGRCNGNELGVVARGAGSRTFTSLEPEDIPGFATRFVPPVEGLRGQRIEEEAEAFSRRNTPASFPD